jgi:arylsulfatase A-like enzyme
MNKNVACLIALVVGCIGSFNTPCVAGEARPNIVLVITDDQGYGDAQCYWKTEIETPAMDSIAKSGARFTQFRVNPLCAPTRASIFTGQTSIECGMWRGPSQKAGNTRAFKPGVKLLPQFLAEAGYATGMFGKWHLGYRSPDTPNDRGFREFVGFLGGAHPYWPGQGADFLRNGKPIETEKHATDLFADEAIAFIRANRSRPFFCYVPLNAVHGPLWSPDRPRPSGKPEWLAKYESRGIDFPRRDYGAVLSHADARIGDILKTLDELGLTKSTLFICVSDNGAIVDKYPGSVGPLRGAKGQTYEGGIRVPAVMRWPGVIPPGTVSRADAVHFDLFSTMMEVAGLAVPKQNGKHPVHGVSLLAHLRSGGKASLPDRYLFWDLYGKMAALHGDWKIVAEAANHHGQFAKAVATAEETDFELYNLRDDLGETQNLAAKHPDIYGDLKSRYVDWLRRAGIDE